MGRRGRPARPPIGIFDNARSGARLERRSIARPIAVLLFLFFRCVYVFDTEYGIYFGDDFRVDDVYGLRFDGIGIGIGICNRGRLIRDRAQRCLCIRRGHGLRFRRVGGDQSDQ